ERMLAEPDAVAVAERDVHARRARRGRYRDAAAGPRSEQRRAGNVVGVHVRVERITKPKPELAKQRGVSPSVLEDRIDQNGFPRLGVREQIRVSRRARVEELAEYEGHRAASRFAGRESTLESMRDRPASR